jgi:hypothetical protein
MGRSINDLLCDSSTPYSVGAASKLFTLRNRFEAQVVGEADGAVKLKLSESKRYNYFCFERLGADKPSQERYALGNEFRIPRLLAVDENHSLC